MAWRYTSTLFRGLALSIFALELVQCLPAGENTDGVNLSSQPHILTRFANSSHTNSSNIDPPPSNSTSTKDGTTSGYKTAMYFPNWDIYGRNYQPQDLPADKITHVLYAFANVRAETGEVYLSDTYSDVDKHYPNDSWAESGSNLYGCGKQLYLLKKKHRHMKVLLSIGGWTYSANFAAPMATKTGRAKFAQSAVQLLKDMGFDGLDVDWEYPADAGQAQNMVELLTTTRNALTNYSSILPGKPHFLLTVASPAGPKNYEKLDIAGMDALLDFWNLMAYDYAGSWDTLAGHQANLYASKSDPESTPFNTDDAVQYYLHNGVTPEKLLLGMPLYGRAFTSTQGPGTNFTGVGEGSWEAGVWDYKVLPQSDAKVFYDNETVSSWTYDNATQTMISYDSPEAAAAKLEYIKANGLGGGMWWEGSGDLPENSTLSLVCAGADALGNLETSENVLDYPESQYDNLREGMPEDE